MPATRAVAERYDGLYARKQELVAASFAGRKSTEFDVQETIRSSEGELATLHDTMMRLTHPHAGQTFLAACQDEGLLEQTTHVRCMSTYGMPGQSTTMPKESVDFLGDKWQGVTQLPEQTTFFEHKVFGAAKKAVAAKAR